MIKQKILVVCYYDIDLSSMIAALLARVLCECGSTKQFTVESAGLIATEAGDSSIPAAKLAITAMIKEGLDINGHRSRFVGDLRPGLQSYYRIYTATQLSFGLLLARYNAPKDRTILLFAETGGIHLSSSANQYEYSQCVAQLKPELRRMATDFTKKQCSLQS